MTADLFPSWQEIIGNCYKLCTEFRINSCHEGLRKKISDHMTSSHHFIDRLGEYPPDYRRSIFMKPDPANRTTKTYLENQETSGHPISMAPGGSFEVGEGEESDKKMEDVLGGVAREAHSTVTATTRRRVAVCDGCRTQYSCSHEAVRKQFFFFHLHFCVLIELCECIHSTWQVQYTWNGRGNMTIVRI